MNAAFWFIVIFCAVVLWASLSPLFKTIGGDFLNGINNVKKDMSDDESDKTNEEEEKNE